MFRGTILACRDSGRGRGAFARLSFAMLLVCAGVEICRANSGDSKWRKRECAARCSGCWRWSRSGRLPEFSGNLRGTISRGSWWSAVFGLWLSSSIFSYLLIKMIAGADWLWGRLRRAFSAPAKVPAALPAPSKTIVRSDAVDYSRRHFVHDGRFPCRRDSICKFRFVRVCL